VLATQHPLRLRKKNKPNREAILTDAFHGNEREIPTPTSSQMRIPTQSSIAVNTMYKLPATEIEAVSFRRKGARRYYRESGTETAAEIIGPIAGGDDICGVTNGQFSLVDIVEHVLSQTGPADVSIATWTMGIYDAEQAYRFVTDKRIRSIRFVVDPSMFTRRPELAAVLVKAFGPDAFRAVNSHAKFATVRGDGLAVAIRSSMNLNRNERLESFDITACPEMTEFFETLVSKIWRKSIKTAGANRGRSSRACLL
jgi:hypothetical protein